MNMIKVLLSEPIGKILREFIGVILRELQTGGLFYVEDLENKCEGIGAFN